MIRRPPKSTLFPYPTLSRSDQERAVESDEHGPEVPLAEAPVEQSARDLGEPVVHPRQDRENASTEQHVVEVGDRSEEHTSELQSPCNLVCRLLLEKKKIPCLHRLLMSAPPPSLAYGKRRHNEDSSVPAIGACLPPEESLQLPPRAVVLSEHSRAHS